MRRLALAEVERDCPMLVATSGDIAKITICSFPANVTILATVSSSISSNAGIMLNRGSISTSTLCSWVLVVEERLGRAEANHDRWCLSGTLLQPQDRHDLPSAKLMACVDNVSRTTETYVPCLNQRALPRCRRARRCTACKCIQLPWVL